MVGPKMAYAAEVVAANPGCSKLAVAKVVGPHGSTNYGYQIVNRAIRKGLIRATKQQSGRYALEVA